MTTRTNSRSQTSVIPLSGGFCRSGRFCVRAGNYPCCDKISVRMRLDFHPSRNFRRHTLLDEISLDAHACGSPERPGPDLGRCGQVRNALRHHRLEAQLKHHVGGVAVAHVRTARLRASLAGADELHLRRAGRRQGQDRLVSFIEYGRSLYRSCAITELAGGRLFRAVCHLALRMARRHLYRTTRARQNRLQTRKAGYRLAPKWRPDKGVSTSRGSVMDGQDRVRASVPLPGPYLALIIAYRFPYAKC